MHRLKSRFNKHDKKTIESLEKEDFRLEKIQTRLYNKSLHVKTDNSFLKIDKKLKKIIKARLSLYKQLKKLGK